MSRGARKSLALLAVSYVAARLLLVIQADPYTTPDTEWYQGAVDVFGGAERPWLIPLVHALLPDRGVMMLQTGVSATSFVVLAVALAATVRSIPIRVGLMAVVLLIGINPRVINWDPAMLSESFAISATMLLIAAFAHLDVMIARHGASLLGLLVVWGFSRDAHLLIGVALCVALALFVRRAGRPVLAGAVFVVAVWLGLASFNDRTIEGFNVMTHVAQGVGADDREVFDWFVGQGMPASDGFEVEPGRAPQLTALWGDDEFRTWATNEGTRAYVRYALSHPDYLLEPLTMYELDDPGPKRWHQAESFAGVWPTRATAYTIGLVAVSLLTAVLVAGRQRLTGRMWLAIALIASTVPHTMLVFHGSAIEHDRHSIVMQFVLVVSAWWLLALTSDCITVRRQIETPHLSARYDSSKATSDVPRALLYTRISPIAPSKGWMSVPNRTR